jgi:hypothetical protein
MHCSHPLLYGSQVGLELDFYQGRVLGVFRTHEGFIIERIDLLEGLGENFNVLDAVQTENAIALAQAAVADEVPASFPSSNTILHFSIANALDRNDVLQAATPFQLDKSVVILTEGLFPYLTRAEQATLAANVHDLLARYDGVWITSDVNTKQRWDTFRRIDKHMQQRTQTVSSATERSLYDNLFIDNHDVQQFFTSAGFKIEEYSFLHVLDELSSLKRINLDRERIVQTMQDFTVLILTL